MAVAMLLEDVLLIAAIIAFIFQLQAADRLIQIDAYKTAHRPWINLYGRDRRRHRSCGSHRTEPTFQLALKANRITASS